MRALVLPIALLLLHAWPAVGQEAREGSALGVAPARPRPAHEIRADRLDALSARLHRKSTEAEARAAERDIWILWSASDSPTAEVLLQQATRAMNEGAPEPSLAILNRLTGAHPDFAEAWNKRATLYFAMGKFTESLADIDRVLDLEPRHFGALSGRGMIHQRQKNYSAAVAAFNEALAINPNMPAVKDAVKAIGKIEQGI